MMQLDQRFWRGAGLRKEGEEAEIDGGGAVVVDLLLWSSLLNMAIVTCRLALAIHIMPPLSTP